MAATPATTETPVPEVDTTDDGKAIAAGIEAVGGAISSIAGTIGSTELQKLANPCVRQAILEDRLRRMEAGLASMITGANFFAAANQRSVLDSIESWGESAGNSGGKAFPFWLLDSGAITSGPESFLCYSGLFTPGCLISISQGLPTNGSERPSSTNSGHRVGAGLYRYPGPTGEFRGSRFRSEWSAWRRFQRREVWNPASGRPNWRARLAAWCGAYRSTWEVWRPGDPIAANSTIGRTTVMVENYRGVVELARQRCTDQVELTTEMSQAENQRLNQLVADAGALDLETLASEERQMTNLAVAGVLGLALVVLWDKK